jgi:hypothetical protein
MSTTFMGLNLPTPTITVGPAWAQSVNDALTLVDSHDHSTGKGVKIKPNGMDINDNLDMQTHELLNAKSTQLYPNVSTLTGPTNTLKLHSVAGNLYFTNNSGTAVQLTNGGTIVSTPGAAQLVLPQAVASDITISPASQFVYLIVDTTAVRTITLPLASSVTQGRMYIVKDANGLSNINNITIATQGVDLIDGNINFVADMVYGCFWLVTDGNNKWYLS